MKKQISLAYLTIPGTHPVDQIEIAAACGYDGVSLRTISMHLPGEPDYHLAGTELLYDVKKALERTGLKCFDIELGRVADGIDVSSYEPELSAAKELGCEWLISSVWTEDRAFAVREERKLCELAARYGLKVNFEFMGFSGIKDLMDAKRFIDEVNAPNLYLMVDLLHIHRAFDAPEALREIPAERFGFAHLCDGPKEVPPMESPEMKGVARGGRLYLGEGGIDCAAYLGELRQVPYYSIELPNTEAMDRYGKMQHAKKCIESVRRMMEVL